MSEDAYGCARSAALRDILNILRRRHHTVTVNDTAENRGMINAARHMLKVEQI